MRLPFVDIRVGQRWTVSFDLGLLVIGLNIYRHGFVVAVPCFCVEYDRRGQMVGGRA